MARAQNDQLVACTASGETRWQPDFQIRLLVSLQCLLPPMSGCLAAFYSGCQMLSTHVYSCCHRMLYSPRWNISQQNWGGKKEEACVHWQQHTNKWMKKSLIGIPKKYNCNVSEKTENTRASNLCKGDKWFWSTLLLKNNRGGCTVNALSFGRPLIGSVEQQNCVYSS